MKYEKSIKLKDGRLCRLRSGTERDGAAAFEFFCATHAQTDFLLSYPEENSYDPQQKGRFLREKEESETAVQLLAEIGGRLVGMAGIESAGSKEKVRHRASFGITVEKEYWGLGIGRALTEACIECAKRAGFAQLELDVVADNGNAIALYESVGFTEYGRNPRGFRSRLTGWQELVLMRLELDGPER